MMSYYTTVDKRSANRALVLWAIIVGLFCLPMFAAAQSATPPSSNVDPPLNTGDSSQVKAGGLSLGSLIISGGSVFNGKVGMGTSTPSSTLAVVGDIGAQQYCDEFGNNCTAATSLGGGGSSLWSESGSDIYYNTGNVGISDSSPAHPLEVGGNISMSSGRHLYLGSQDLYGDDSNGLFFDSNHANNAAFNLRDSGNTQLGALYGDDTGNFGLLDADGNWAILSDTDTNISFRVNNSEKMQIDSVGSLTVPALANCDTIDTNASGVLSCGTDSAGESLSQEQVQDYVGPMVSGNTESLIAVTYDDAANEFDFVVEPNLSSYTNDAEFITDGNTNWNNIYGFVTSADDSVSGSEMYTVFNDSAIGIVSRTGTYTYDTITNNSSNWDTAYSWGDHAAAGYEADLGNEAGLYAALSDVSQFWEAGDTISSGSWQGNVITDTYIRDDITLSAATIKNTIRLDNNGSGVVFFQGYGAGDAMVIGGSATTDNVDGVGDLYIEDELDVAGNAYFGGTILEGTWQGSAIDTAYISPIYGTDIVNGSVDISTDTNLAAGTNITLSGDTLNVDDAFVLNTGDSISGNMSFSGTAANISLGSNYLSGDGGDEGINIDSSGNVGINTNSPAHELAVHGADTDVNASINGSSNVGLRLYGGTVDWLIQNADYSGGTLLFYDETAGNFAFRVTSGTTNNMTVNGSVTATDHINSSDRRLKNNITTITNPERALDLRGVSFDWKQDGSADYGFIAQEVEEIFPELISTDSTTGMKGVSYGKMSALLLELAKEQQATIQKMSSRMDSLESRLEALEKE